MSYIFDFSNITTYEKYIASIDDRKIFLGQGNNGTVYKVFINGQIPIAVKELQFSPVNYQKKLEILEKETKLLKSITHPNIIKVYFSFLHDNKAQQSRMYYIGMEYATKSLEDIINEKIAFTEQETSDLACQLYRGLEYIQSKNAVHRDIKPANIVLGTDGFYKLCDFGEVQISDQQIKTMALQTLVGTPAYFSPELLNIFQEILQQGGESVELNQFQEYNPAKSDVFSFGLVLLKCLLGKNGNIGGCNSDFNTIENKIYGKFSNNMNSFLLKCLAFDRSIRYNFSEMKKIFDFNAIDAYFELQAFNPKNSYQLLQRQTTSQFEELKEANINFANECQNLKMELASVTTIVSELQKQVNLMAQSSNNVPSGTQIIQQQQQLKIQQQAQQEACKNEQIIQQQPEFKKTYEEIKKKCKNNETQWKDQIQDYRKTTFRQNTKLNWGDYYGIMGYANYYVWNDQTGKENGNYWRTSSGTPQSVIENDIPAAIIIVKEVEKTTGYEFALCLMMLHSNLWDSEKSKNDLLN